ncbi:guanine-1-methyltransferase-domain-containing protein [Entophlyctis helioformis]|nr:guanine-1-methyltransferase-domain-containing protein [Entophlyctis helioformis]
MRREHDDIDDDNDDHDGHAEPATDAPASSSTKQQQHQQQINKDGEQDTAVDLSTLSKNARKRLLKQQRWDSQKDERKAKAKAMKKAVKEKRVAAGLTANPPKKRRKDQEDSGVTIAIDCSFESKMTEKETRSTISQLMFSYVANRAQPVRATLSVTSFTPQQTLFMSQRAPEHPSWTPVMTFSDLPVTAVHDPAVCVYLTADSPNTIDTLEAGTVYIVGGIVDKNRHKGLCLAEAERLGVRHGRLPIGEYIDMAARKVLTVNHVVEGLVHYLNSRDWKTAFLKVLPQRKNAKGKDSDNEDGDEEIQQSGEDEG